MKQLKNFTNALSKLEDSSLKKQVEFFINIVDFYDTWDKFNNNIEIWIRKNKKNFRLNYHLENNIIKKIDEDLDLSKFFKDENLEFYNQLNCNLDFLDKKISHKNKNIKENINYYLPDLLNNAKRRIEEGKFDDAVARLYRAIELIAQIGLSNCGLIDGEILKNEKKFHLSKKSIYDKSNWELLFLIDSLNLKGWNNIDHHTVKTTSKNSYEILKVLGLDFAKDYLNDGDLYNKISKRNNSILAHGLEPINKEIAENIYSLVLKYAKNSWSEIEEYMKLAKFPKFEF